VKGNVNDYVKLPTESMPKDGEVATYSYSQSKPPLTSCQSWNDTIMMRHVWNIIECLASGVAVHSAALNYNDRTIIEDLFQAQDILVVWY
jgi:hypothetical protein